MLSVVHHLAITQKVDANPIRKDYPKLMNFFKSLNQKIMFGLGGVILGMLIALAFGRALTLLIIVLIVAGIFGWPLLKSRIGNLGGKKQSSDSVD